MSMRAIIIGNHATTRQALRARFEAGTDVVVVDESTHADHAAYAIDRRRPDVVVADLDREQDGTAALAALVDASDDTIPVVVVSAMITRDWLRAAFVAGARGVVSMDSRPDVLLRAMRASIGGSAFIDPEISILMLDASGAPSTALQRDVLVAASAGQTRASVASYARCTQAEVVACAHGIVQRSRELGAPPEVVDALTETIATAS